MKQFEYDEKGLLRCARYAFAPNLLHYCGPEKQKSLTAYLQEYKFDRGLTEILAKFDTVKKYLTLLSENNQKENDIFNSLAVDAYWIGNSTLENAKWRPFADFLKHELQLSKKLKPGHFQHTLSIMDMALPCHNNHVFNIFMRTGNLLVPYTLKTMDACRISWGKVTRVSSGTKTDTHKIDVITQPLIYEDDQLKIGPKQVKQVISYFEKPQVNDWVTLHWGVVCEIASLNTIKRLQKYTLHSLKFTQGVL